MHNQHTGFAWVLRVQRCEVESNYDVGNIEKTCRKCTFVNLGGHNRFENNIQQPKRERETFK